MTSPKLNLSLLVNTGLSTQLNYTQLINFKSLCILEFKAKKRVTISDYSFVEFSIEILNISFTPKDIISSFNLMNLIIQI